MHYSLRRLYFHHLADLNGKHNQVRKTVYLVTWSCYLLAAGITLRDVLVSRKILRKEKKELCGKKLNNDSVEICRGECGCNNGDTESITGLEFR